MNREEVVSTVLKSVGYEPDTQILEIEFQSGDVYQYFDVPQDVVAALLNADSKGTYFNDSIRDAYPTEKLDG